MSLNGLDDVKVKEAHDAAAAEPGGWFLLKYASRDEVELLGRGNGGIVEIRNTIAQFEEPDALFGFLRYRRRNVLIKYVPEDCSRLVQARVTVHFNAVTERFSPHDTVFPIASAKELRDTTLSAACSLHTASGSTSSSTSSLRRRRLMEIAEDAEEEDRAKRQSTVPEERPPTAKTSSITGNSLPPSSPPHTSPTGLTPPTSYRSRVSETETSPPPAREPQGPEIGPRSSTEVIEEPRKSSQSTRHDLYSYTSKGSNGKPKIKLGPRPSLDVAGRPHTSSATSQYRPVSTLPAGFKLFSSRGSRKEKDRPQSTFQAERPSVTLSPPPVPDVTAGSLQIVPNRPHTSGGRPNTSSGTSIRPLVSLTTSAPKTPTITPEKARLMKALELRKKQMSMLPPDANTISPTTSEGSKSPILEHNGISIVPTVEANDNLEMLNDMAKGDDSGIAFDASSTLKTDESDATRSDSYPVSPVGPSERAESTRASSISESTDETILEVQTSKLKAAEDPDGEGIESTMRHEPNQLHVVQTEQAESTAVETITSALRQLEPVPNQLPPSPAESKVNHSVHVVLSEEREEPAQTDLPTNVVEVQTLVQDAPEVVVTAEAPALDSEKLISPERSNQEVAEEPKLVSPNGAVPQPTSSANPEVAEWNVARSKFSDQELQGAVDTPAIPKEPLSSSQTHETAAPKSPIESTFSTDTKRSLNDEDYQQENEQLSPKKRKHRVVVEPIRTDIEFTDRSDANSEAHFSSDEDLMEELQSAIFQEAKPISVSKSPISPVFPSPKKPGNRFSRAFSNPMRKETSVSKTLQPPNLLRTEASRSVSSSAAYLNRINQQPAQPMAKKVNLGSGISQRIKALEKLSSKAPAVITAPIGPSSVPSPAFFSVRKASGRGSSRSPSVAERADSLTRNTPSPPSISGESSPEAFKLRERSESVQSRIKGFKATPVPGPESISVTARIIRDPSQPFPKPELGRDPSQYSPLDLRESPLLINHQQAVLTSPKESIRERRLSTSSKTTTKSRRSSITIVKDFIKEGRASFSDRRRSLNLDASAISPSLVSPGRSRPPSVHTSSVHQRPVSISSRRSTSSRDATGAFSPTLTTGSSSSTNDEIRDKKSNRASRILRRLSSSVSSNRKSGTHPMSPTVREESEAPIGMDSAYLSSSNPSNHPTTPSITSTKIGDVNVQFPDSLLWKRRSLLLDSQGYLILSPALASANANDKTSGGSTRRFHLSEFRMPGIPDVEMQELPNSVVLDFIEGGGLQIACEDRAGQGRVLTVLQEAHSACAGYSL